MGLIKLDKRLPMSNVSDVVAKATGQMCLEVEQVDSISTNTPIKKGHSLVTLGKINNCTATLLIDSGATTNFINQQFCQRNRLKLTAIAKQRVGMADNRGIKDSLERIWKFLASEPERAL